MVGRGLNYSTAYEFALKMMETCYVVAERFSSADFLHGPIAMVDRAFPMFLFTPAGVTWDGMRDMVQRLASLKAETLIFTDRGNRAAIELNPRAVVIPARFCRRKFSRRFHTLFRRRFSRRHWRPGRTSIPTSPAR